MTFFFPLAFSYLLDGGSVEGRVMWGRGTGEWHAVKVWLGSNRITDSLLKAFELVNLTLMEKDIQNA